MLRIALALTLLSFTACNKKDDNKAGGGGDQPAAAAGPLKTNPKDLFGDFTKPGNDGMALLKKYHEGATFSAVVKTAPGSEAPTSMMLDVGDGQSVILASFVDTAKDKIATVKAGDTVTVTCKIGGANGHMMQVIDCTPQ
jgi:hypothetical protein